MPMQERVQLARGLAEKHGRRLSDVEDWRPLLRFTGGNPLAVTVLVGQAPRDKLATGAQIEAFVEQLRRGEARVADDVAQGRSRSLAASLQYGFEHAFTEPERRRLALLHFFQGSVNVITLQAMGHPDADWALPELRGLDRESWIALLDRAAEVGLLTAHGGGYYTIHPALPWFFKGLFNDAPIDQPAIHQPAINQPQGASPRLPESAQQPDATAYRLMASRAFVEAMGELGNYYIRQYTGGNRDVIRALAAEEANLLYARQLARQHGWWDSVIGTMQGLRMLSDHTGRRAEWARLVAEIVPEFVDPQTDGPLPGREENWGLVTEYRVHLAREMRDWPEAEHWYHRSLELRDERDRLGRGKCHMQLGYVAFERFQEARSAGRPEAELVGHLNTAVGFYHQALDLLPDNAVNDLAVTHNALGVTYRNADDIDRALPHYRESIRLKEASGNLYGAATTRFNVALALAQSGRVADAREYARAALRNFETYGAGAAQEVQRTQQLLAELDARSP
jgi:tetratricopeptide (TPR) repeat protein